MLLLERFLNYKIKININLVEIKFIGGKNDIFILENKK